MAKKMNDSQTFRVLEKMIELTRKKELVWVARPDSEYWFIASALRYSYSIDARDLDDRHPIDFRVWNSHEDDQEHNEVIAIASSDDDRVGPATVARFETLYDIVKDRVMSAEDVYEQVLKDLGMMEEPF